MNRLASPPTGDHAFTLMEMLVVIGIIGLLAGLIVPAVGRSVESARSTACLSNLRQLGIALQSYVDDHGDRLPVMHDRRHSTNAAVMAAQTGTVDRVLGPWLGNTSGVLRCPSDRDGIFARTGSSYSWNSLLNGQPASRPEILGIAFDPREIPVFFDKEAFHRIRGPGRGVNYLQADGHLRNLLAVEGTRPRP